MIGGREEQSLYPEMAAEGLPHLMWFSVQEYHFQKMLHCRSRGVTLQ